MTMIRRQPLDLDANVENADWTKSTWDLPFDNVEDLKRWLHSTGTSVRHFKTLPIYRLNVKKLGWLQDL